MQLPNRDHSGALAQLQPPLSFLVPDQISGQTFLNLRDDSGLAEV
jgi:hypothetical protein